MRIQELANDQLNELVNIIVVKVIGNKFKQYMQIQNNFEVNTPTFDSLVLVRTTRGCTSLHSYTDSYLSDCRTGHFGICVDTMPDFSLTSNFRANRSISNCRWPRNYPPWSSCIAHAADMLVHRYSTRGSTHSSKSSDILDSRGMTSTLRTCDRR